MATHTTKIFRDQNMDGRHTRFYQERVEDEPTIVNSDGGAVVRSQSMAGQAVYFLLDVVEIFLAVRLVFRLLAAKTANAFVSFIYQATAPLVAPFRGIIPNTSVNGAIIDWSTVLAMIIY